MNGQTAHQLLLIESIDSQPRRRQRRFLRKKPAFADLCLRGCTANT